MSTKRVKRYSAEWKKKVSKGWFKKGTPSRNKGLHLSEDTKKNQRSKQGKTEPE